ncbi:cytochrome P450 [Streptomyces cyaneofuscatus]|uniref:Cytochrome P450 n=1 Tax=Streptomyces cyaneofuscatus TaxID=66883 RepID=A0ABZ1F473_9ACTN|nr:cytochrome P450 [Streptomyces cyaneofuscatus]WSB11210.1 cytochrome P450 [Streptomyces cyaneofuscatus]WSD45257.1 cytochrome P450 [Streptomyces cyaneofuscatus]
MKDLVFVESNTTGTGVAALETAARLGTRPVLLTDRADRYRGLDGTPAEVVVCDTGSVDALTQVLEARGGRERIAGITTTSEFYLPHAARLARRFRLPGNPPESVEACRDKAETRTTLTAAGLPQVPFAVVRDAAHTADAVARVGLPCVVKPTDDTGSRNVRVCTTGAETAEQVDAVLAVRTNVRGQPTSGAALVEGFAEGREYSVELFSEAGSTTCLGIVEKSVTGAPYCVEHRHVFPAPLPDEDAHRIVDVARRAVRALGVQEGATHVEVMDGPLGCVPIEVNCRPAGGMIPELIRLVSGVDVVEQHVRAALGLRAVLPVTPPEGAAGIQFLTADAAGSLEGIEGADTARELSGVHAVTVTAEPGARVAPATDAYGRLGHVIAHAGSPEEVRLTLDRAMALIRVGVKSARCPVAVDYDTHDPAIAADPYPTYEQLRSGCPVKWSRAWGGFWVAAGHREVAAASRAAETFETSHEQADGTVQGVSIPPLGHTGRLVPLEIPSPDSLRYRRLVATFYAPSRVRARTAEFRALAAACVDDVIEQGSCDLVQALTLRLPAVLTLRDIGLPEDRWHEVDSLIHDALLRAPHDLDGSREAAQLACLEIIEALDDQLEDGEDRPDLIGHLLRSTVDGAPVKEEDIVSIMYLLLLGIDPTSTLTATALWYLARNPGLRARLSADRSLLPRAAEEFLRWVSPVQGTGRTATRDVTLGGQEVRKGERVLLTWASANRDEAVYETPGEVDIDRAAERHLAFGGGPHYCLGAGLVRAMFTAMVEEVLDRMPDYRIADGAEVTWFPDLSSVYGVNSLPVEFTPGPRRR